MYTGRIHIHNRKAYNGGHKQGKRLFMKMRDFPVLFRKAQSVYPAGLLSPTSRLSKHVGEDGFHLEGIPLKGLENLWSSQYSSMLSYVPGDFCMFEGKKLLAVLHNEISHASLPCKDIVLKRDWCIRLLLPRTLFSISFKSMTDTMDTPRWK